MKVLSIGVSYKNEHSQSGAPLECCRPQTRGTSEIKPTGHKAQRTQGRQDIGGTEHQNAVLVICFI